MEELMDTLLNRGGLCPDNYWDAFLHVFDVWDKMKKQKYGNGCNKKSSCWEFPICLLGFRMLEPTLPSANPNSAIEFKAVAAGFPDQCGGEVCLPGSVA